MAFSGHCHIITTSSTRQLHYIDRGQAFKRRDEILTQAGLRARAGDNQHIGHAESALPKTTADIAAEIGISKRALQVEKQIATNILPEVQEAIKTADLLLRAGYPPA